ncbi:MAG: hypothetical protein CMI08_07035 [Oceanospirillaceae bacterium]|uniref:hypothetical protein n=1 Tax=unclassified Thalassolituus TaxID=2624967 RepID=UPI000C3E0994|nr:MULTISPECIES: hypothetical protein [unclassified Thalassolituus]MAS24290.1 hypothetical protein [Oceanospirillaceae bacterium]MAX98945.1 hypothetical protein [Oceanospirillaceae bacterium]MBL36740.1 hypothetical protein [Oceanospirillaceae bacterium]MBS54060.1 hypothetical protein [Oceanospirillaceae bacterium]|tara:strand:- start:11698 stop:12597 length:900 start_codon:yes stop_codon:yes gene_type:complete
MKLLPFYSMAAVLLYSASGNAAGDRIISDDAIVQGGLCVGQDCVSGELYSHPPLKLKENNLRVRLTDTSTIAEPVRVEGPDYYYEYTINDSWVLVANSYANGGANYFAIERTTIGTLYYLSDGTAPNYMCYQKGTNFPYPNPSEATADDMDIVVVGVIPEGGQWKTPYCNYQVVPQLFNGIYFDRTDGVAIGRGAEVLAGTVALGNGENLRRLAHVAHALNDMDLLSVKDMNVYSDQQATLDQLSDQLTELENLVYLLENPEPGTVGKSRSGSSGGAFSWLLLLSVAAPLLRRRDRVQS